MNSKIDRYVSEVDGSLKDINKKMINVATKDDGTLMSMLQNMIDKLKEDVLKSVCRQIEVIES